MATLLFLLAAASASFGQDPPIAGGYGDADVADAGVIAAAKFAVTKRSRTQHSTITLASIKNAKIQVVAGLNYDLCMEVNIKKPGKKTIKRYVKTVVYKNLKGAHSLTSWKNSSPPDCEN